MLVDDNLTFLAAVRHFLSMMPDATVVGEAHDGHHALTLATQLQPDLVLLDIVMPELNGLNVARAMQSWPCPPSIVFLSMHDSESYRAAARDLGAIGFVGKADFVVGLLPIIANLTAARAATATGEST